ncbi:MULTISPECIES: ribulose-bisphosphate carboxylase large subunit family protein [unclassified Bacillus (in: firmicutes)]|uniref:ribulose-bisphosphate carboxylase large subunit family protein n=1 Tax=unclassified Bacillus (in: firmicutes) TaxID=185979 RepID=UPI0022803233|nr:ribulose-bisphosphate carboxylase large subunit family protein [Bacillus sp. S20C3]MCY8202198.1 ribulose-bisphosphate carboxylase large subunit family protein [Bacillus sp. N12A5]MCY8290562.1 ribulose-bisphosphate carboxylase large subunit family protein [Bacillus sp. N13C7]MCY8640131.1 ribulose-bisphosphate carboxylase large subunit family protein [Bacillus sp. S17B2]MCY8721561.1 ribulose-bisphosphate carboxylase large subunit family protein [Bacillus sp. S10C12M]MCY9144365.1 ribulose-bisp
MSQDRVFATYHIETPYDLEYAAKVMAGEQSTGTFIAVPGETEELKDRFAAKVVSIEELEVVSSPTLPGSKLPHASNKSISYHRGKVVLSFPLHNFGPSIPNLLSAVAGNLYELREVSGLRLMDLEFPNAFFEKYPGPKFGIEGTRKLANVYNRPLIGTIIKPSIGLTPDELRGVVRDLALAGIDFIKDDELNANPPYAPLKDRVTAAMEEIERVADKTGKKLMYAFNITDDMDQLERNYETVLKAGGNCVMVSINSVGLAGVAHLRKFSEVPIHGHRNQWGAITRCPQLGMEFTAYQKLCRLVGVDHLHCNAINSKFYESNESVIKSVKDCITPMFGGYTVMPVLSSGQWAGTAPISYESMETIDVMHLAGGGIIGHPGGSKAGVKSMIQAWEAAVSGVSLNEYAETHIELKQAIEKFGK